MGHGGVGPETGSVAKTGVPTQLSVVSSVSPVGGRLMQRVVSRQVSTCRHTNTEKAILLRRAS